MILDKWSKEIKGQKSKAKIEGMSNDSSCFRRVWKLLKSGQNITVLYSIHH